ncbi:radical SAM protein [Methylotetracoccus oryzae]|uniref:radical SAM protein n=1 Tax=Methylotetracoccus oryzae TaxID=1919059 RepID=UPI001119409A|nr:radical SAM protein [Methylotetracoccus oryzae]
MKLTTQDHRRDSAELTYLYPVLSRRSGGVSIGINLNPNNACNWQCRYCQVPDLVRGAAPEIDLDRLRDELSTLLGAITAGTFFNRFDVPDECRRVCDIAISGNGEPTSARALPAIIDLIGSAAHEAGLLGHIKLVLITNGSLIRRPHVRAGLTRWSTLGGEAWFKIDSATPAGLQRINRVARSPVAMALDLETCAALCPTWIQTCLFQLDGEAPSEVERQAYLDFLAARLQAGVPLLGVMLYGLARPSLQAEASRLSPLSAEWMESFAERIRQLGLTVSVHP